MPLQVISDALNLPDAVTRLNEPYYAFAQTLNLDTSTGLVVWHSPIVRYDDPMFASVAHMMDRTRVEELLRVSIEDPGMMYGRLEGFVSLLHPKGTLLAPSPEQQVFVDIFRDWGDPVPILELHEKLTERCLRVMH